MNTGIKGLTFGSLNFSRCNTYISCIFISSLLQTADRGLGGSMSLPKPYNKWTKSTYIFINNAAHISINISKQTDKAKRSTDDKTQTASDVCAAFLLFRLVTSTTPDTCSEPVLNTPKALHKIASTLGPRMGHAPDTVRDTSLLLAMRQCASQSTLLVRQKHTYNSI